MIWKSSRHELCVVLDPAWCKPFSVEDVAIHSIKGGATMIQLRSKYLCNSEFAKLSRRIKSITERNNIPFIINDRVDIALKIAASGVHLGQTDMPPTEARILLGPRALIGLSVSSIDQAIAARTAPIQYLGAGPIFATQTKIDFSRQLSLDELSQICANTKLPVLGIGGIQLNNATSVMKAGAKGIAVVSAICSNNDPETITNQFSKTIKRGSND